MIGGLRPYPAYRRLGLRWLEEAPKHWEVRRNAQLFSQRNESNRAELPILEVSLRTGVRVRNFDRSDRKQVMTDRSKYKRAASGDVAYNMMRMWQGAVGVAPVDGLVSPAYVVAKPLPEVTARYFVEMFRTQEYMAQIDAYSRGIVKDRNRLYWEDFKQMPSVVPPAEEQAAIVQYLGWLDRRIGRYIRAKKKLIGLLEEQRQAIIQRAVTRGLDPGVSLKPSGVDWLGHVPAHWEIRKLRRCGSIAGGMTPSMENRRFWDGEIPWVTPKDMKRPVIQDSRVRVTPDALKETPLRLIDSPAVLLVVRGMILTRKVPIAKTSVPVTINQDMKALSPWKEVSAEFLALSMNSAQGAFMACIDEAGHGTRRLPTERWRELVVAVPPEEEQAAIASAVRGSTRKLAAAIDQAQREIDFLYEYRTRLAADVVTGKLDVREAVAGLPDQAVEPDLLDEAPDQDDAAEEHEVAAQEVEA